MDKKTKTTQVGLPRIIGGFLAALAALLAVSAPIVNYSFRIGYIFIDKEVFAGFSELLFWVMVANGIYALGVAVAALAKKRIPISIIIISFLSLIFSLLFWLVNYVSSDIAHVETAYIIIAGIIPFLAALFGVPFLLLCYPNLKISAKARNITAAVLSLIFVVTLGTAAVIKAPPISFEFESQPIVLDIGGGYYSVVFATNADAQGYVTYQYNGEEKTVYANDAGYKSIGKIHAVKIPRDELDGAEYAAHATRVLDRLSYGGKLGKSIDTKSYTLKDTTDKSDTKIISASDWHNQMGVLEQAAAYYKKEADLVIFMGDYADFYVNEQQITDYFLKGAFILTGGEIPGIFVRGNHEVRGNEKIEDFGLKLGLSNMYYQVERGDYVFTVLDTAESEAGDEWEHRGFYDMIPYFERQMTWFESLDNQSTKKNILLLHDASFTSGQDDAHKDIQSRYRAKANAINPIFSISGHTHYWTVMDANPENFNFPRIEDGGRGEYGRQSLAGYLKESKDLKTEGIMRTILDLITLKQGLPRYVISLIEIDATNSEVTLRGQEVFADKEPPEERIREPFKI